MPIESQVDPGVLPVRIARRRPSTPHRRLTGHTGRVTDLAVVALPDGRELLVSTGLDAAAVVWDPASGEPVTRLIGHEDAILAVCSFTGPGGTPCVVTGGADGTLRFWSPGSGEPIGEPIRGDFDAVTRLVTRWDGAQVRLAAIVGSDAGGDMILDVPPLTGEQGHVIAAVGCHGLRDLVVCRLDGWQVFAALATDPVDGQVSIRLWDAETGEEARDPIGLPDDDAQAMTVLSPEPGRSILAVVVDERVLQIDPVTADVLGTGLVHPESQTSAVTSFRTPTGQLRLVTVISTISHLWNAKHPSVMVWDPVSEQLVGRFPTGHLGRIDTVVALDGGTALAVACPDGSVRWWRLDEALAHQVPGLTGREGSGAPLHHVPEPEGPGLLLTTRDSLGVTGEDLPSEGVEHDLWDAATAELVGTLPGRFADAVAHRDASGRATVLTLDEGGELTSWDPRTLSRTRSLATGITRYRWLAAEPGGSRVVCSGAGSGVDVWDLGTGELMTTLGNADPEYGSRFPTLEPEGVAWLHTGRGPRLVLCHPTNLTLWNPATGETRAQRPPGGAALSGPVHPGPGWLIVVGDHEGRSLVLDADSLELINILAAPSGIADVAALPDGRVVTCSGEGGVDLWSARTGTRLAHHDAGVALRGISVLPDGALALGLPDGWSIVEPPWV